MVGALGIALGNMVGSLTVGKRKYANVEADLLALNEGADRLRLELLALMDADAEAFAPLAKAYSIPKEDPRRDELMEAALLTAVKPPVEVIEKCAEALGLIADYAQKGSALAVSDAGCAAALCRAAMESAALNVYINTKAMKDRQTAEGINTQVKAALLRCCALAERVYDEVRGRLIG